MRPYDRRVATMYHASGSVWLWSSTSPGETMGESAQIAWSEAFDEPLDLDALPEPYDMLGDDKLYVLPHRRYLFVSGEPNPSVEIRQAMPLYFVNNGSGPGASVYSTFQSKDKTSALIRLVDEIFPSIGGEPPEWYLYERFQPEAEPQLVLKGQRA